MRIPLALCIAASVCFLWSAEEKPATAPPQQQRPPRPVRPGVKTPGVQISMSGLQPEAVFDVPGTPDWLALGDGVVYVSNKPKDSVSKLDVKTDKVLAVIPVGSKPCSGLAVGFGSLWVPNCGDNTVSRVDLKTDKVTATFPISIGDTEGGIATGAGSVWMMIDKKGTLARIDPADNKVVAEIPVAAGSYCVAFGEGAVWVTSTERNLLTRVDPNTNLVVETIPVGKAPRFLTLGEGGVWTLNQGDGTVTRVDPKTNKVVATVEVGVPGTGGEIAAGEGSVWVTIFQFPISRIDAMTNKVVQQFKGEGGDSIRAGLGFIWLSNLRAGNVWKLDPKRIEATLNP
jgi:virginiamycin B lyase